VRRAWWLSLLVAGCAHSAHQLLATVPVRGGPFEATLTVVGETQPFDSANLAIPNQLWGSVQEVLPEGSQVKAGQVVCRINVRDFQQRADDRAQQARIQELQLLVTRNDLPMKRDEIARDVAASKQTMREAQLDWHAFSRGPQPEVAAQARTDDAIAALRLATDELAQKKALYDKGFLSADELQTAELNRMNLEAAAERARIARDLLAPKAQPDDYQRKQLAKAIAEDRFEITHELAKARAATLGFSTQKASFRAQQLRTEANELAAKLKLAAMTSPLSGVLIYPKLWGWQKVHIGMDVWNGLTILSVARTDHLKILTNVGERQIGSIREGMPALVRIPGFTDRTYPGRVSRVGRVSKEEDPRDSESRKVFEVEVTVDKPAPEIRPAMKVNVTLVAARAPSALSVPQDALFTAGKQSYVLVDRGGGARRVDVTPQVWGEDFVTVSGNLKAGDRLYLLDPKDPALVAEPDEETPGDSEPKRSEKPKRGRHRGP